MLFKNTIRIRPELVICLLRTWWKKIKKIGTEKKIWWIKRNDSFWNFRIIRALTKVKQWLHPQFIRQRDFDFEYRDNSTKINTFNFWDYLVFDAKYKLNDFSILCSFPSVYFSIEILMKKIMPVVTETILFGYRDISKLRALFGIFGRSGFRLRD